VPLSAARRPIEMKRAIAFAVVAFASLLMFAPTAQGGSNPIEDGESAAHGRSKSSSCKSSCFHAEATCRGKRGACMAARQRCVRGCR
jgi:hypothetical protein